jgi:hypothetical protein
MRQALGPNAFVALWSDAHMDPGFDNIHVLTKFAEHVDALGSDFPAGFAEGT